MAGPSVHVSTQSEAQIPKSHKTGNAAVWARVENAAANKNVGAVPGLTARVQQKKEKYPALPSSAHTVSSNAVRGATPWASSMQPAKSPNSTYFPIAASAASSILSSPAHPVVLGKPPARPRAPSHEFPSLPAVLAGPSRSEQKAAIFGRNGAAPPMSWGSARSPGTATLQETTVEPSPGLEAVQRSLDDFQLSGESLIGKKKKGKQVLLRYGL